MLARLAIALGLNLNWVFDPVTAYQRLEPLRMAKRREANCEDISYFS